MAACPWIGPEHPGHLGEPLIFQVAVLGYKELFNWLVASGTDPLVVTPNGQYLVDHLLEFDKEDMADWVHSQISGL